MHRPIVVQSMTNSQNTADVIMPQPLNSKEVGYGWILSS